MEEEIKIAIILSLLENGSSMEDAKEFINVLDEGIFLKEKDSIQLYNLFRENLKNYPDKTNIGKIIRILSTIKDIKKEFEKLEKLKILINFLNVEIPNNEFQASVLLKTFISKFNI